MINIPQVLTIGGTDSSGGAGINADLKTFHNQGVYSSSIVTGMTAQNTLGVQHIQVASPEFICEQFKSIFSDLDISATKTGALFGDIQVESVIQCIKKYKVKNLVVDPVMIAKGGERLLSLKAVNKVKKDLLPLAELVTPNIPEAEELSGIKIDNENKVTEVLYNIQSLGVKNVLIKGGHASGNDTKDVLLTHDGIITYYTSKRFNTIRTHGTGDTLSSYIVSRLACGESIQEALPKAKKFINKAISEQINVGHGHGPLNHWV